MAKVLLGVTGSVAAIRTPKIHELLKSAGHEVKIVATASSLYFFDPVGLPVIRDEDEWPGQGQGRLWQRDDPVLHIELRRWADVFVIAPLDANTLAKLALGLSDNCLTCVARAWDMQRPLVLAPAMNTLMWQHPATVRHLRQLAEDHGAANIPPRVETSSLVAFINAHCPRLRIVPTVVKELACNDVGDGAMAAPEDIIAMIPPVY